MLFALASWIFYSSGKHHLLDRQREALDFEAKKVKNRLRQLHQSDAPRLLYPHTEGVDSAIYDVDKSCIFGTYATPQPLERCEKGTMCHIEEVNPHYLGAAYLKLTRKIDYAPIAALQRKIILFMLGAGLFFLVLGYYLGRLFIAPMRESMQKLNRFIQDTTHELNTPISTILTNIEMLETLEKCQKGSEELTRIEIASRTLSRIYDDLTYLNLNHTYHRRIVPLDMGKLLQERLSYFGSMMAARGLHVSTQIAEGVVVDMDRNDALRLIDNLLSNAIKYNIPQGSLIVELTAQRLLIRDTGSGIAEEDLEKITRRFSRANKSEGGFGIGLDIVRQVAERYGFVFEISSRKGIGTEVTVQWPKTS